jgi:hypothetical protein
MIMERPISVIKKRKREKFPLAARAKPPPIVTTFPKMIPGFVSI